MIKTVEEAVAAYKKSYIELASDLRWYETKPSDGLKEANCDGRMRAMSALYDFKRNIASTLGMAEDEMKALDAECEPAMQLRTAEKTRDREAARKAYRASL